MWRVTSVLCEACCIVGMSSVSISGCLVVCPYQGAWWCVHIRVPCGFPLCHAVMGGNRYCKDSV